MWVEWSRWEQRRSHSGKVRDMPDYRRLDCCYMRDLDKPMAFALPAEGYSGSG